MSYAAALQHLSWIPSAGWLATLLVIRGFALLGEVATIREVL